MGEEEKKKASPRRGPAIFEGGEEGGPVGKGGQNFKKISVSRWREKIFANRDLCAGKKKVERGEGILSPIANWTQKKGRRGTVHSNSKKKKKVGKRTRGSHGKFRFRKRGGKKKGKKEIEALKYATETASGKNPPTIVEKEQKKKKDMSSPKKKKEGRN